jgi:membrane-associated protease RseP (regulator of RpoE activity)
MGWRLNLLLVVAAFGTMMIAGGPVYALCAILILGSHEMGHYVFCRWYGVDATLPYFIPAPPLFFLFGTFGAVIRMRPPIPSRRALFDIGIAGPLAGFAVALPILVIGVATSQVVPLPPDTRGLLEFGDPPLITLLTRWLHGTVPPTSTLLMSPALLAGWFGLLVTAMNLFPVGQLDGGHISYALSPRTHRAVARLVTVAMMALVIGSLIARLANPWFLWTIVLVLLSRFRHPPVQVCDEPLGAARIALAVAAAVVFFVSFIPVPIVNRF